MIKKVLTIVSVTAWSIMLVAINEIADDFGNSVSGPGVTVGIAGGNTPVVTYFAGNLLT